jgi:hypothetical protein
LASFAEQLDVADQPFHRPGDHHVDLVEAGEHPL